MFQTDLFDHQFIPAAKNSDKLMIVFHGRGDSLKPFKNFNQELNIPEMNFLLLNAPRKYLDGFSWYGEPPFQKQGVLKIRQRLNLLIAELLAHGWKTKNIFLLGFSQGCLVSTDLALHYQGHFAGVIGISGYFQFFPRWRSQISDKSAGTPWLLTHGSKDDVLPLNDTKYGMKKLENAGIKIKWVELDKKHVFLEEEYDLIRNWIDNHI